MLFFRKRKPLFRDVAATVLRQKAIRSIETQKAALQWHGRLVAAFGNLRIDAITEQAWTEYVLRECQRRQRKFFDDRKHMRNVLNYAHRNGLLEKKLHLPIPDPPWEAGREITGDELARLEGAAGPELRFQIRIGWKLGLRLREMLRLRWDQFDWKKRLIRLRAADTKTRRARTVPIPADLVTEFRARRARAACQFVFPARGGLRAQNSNKTAWRRCKAKAGVEARWHDLRHTCATLLLRRGVPVHVAKRYLGMSEPVLTRIYTHLSTEDLRAAAEAMTEAKESR